MVIRCDSGFRLVRHEFYLRILNCCFIWGLVHEITIVLKLSLWGICGRIWPRIRHWIVSHSNLKLIVLILIGHKCLKFTSLWYVSFNLSVEVLIKRYIRRASVALRKCLGVLNLLKRLVDISTLIIEFMPTKRSTREVKVRLLLIRIWTVPLDLNGLTVMLKLWRKLNLLSFLQLLIKVIPQRFLRNYSLFKLCQRRILPDILSELVLTVILRFQRCVHPHRTWSIVQQLSFLKNVMRLWPSIKTIQEMRLRLLLYQFSASVIRCSHCSWPHSALGLRNPTAADSRFILIKSWLHILESWWRVVCLVWVVVLVWIHSRSALLVHYRGVYIRSWNSFKPASCMRFTLILL